nr:exodeoxyribonuclease VII large subunit [Thorsellia anophelis]
MSVDRLAKVTKRLEFLNPILKFRPIETSITTAMSKLTRLMNDKIKSNQFRLSNIDKALYPTQNQIISYKQGQLSNIIQKFNNVNLVQPNYSKLGLLNQKLYQFSPQASIQSHYQQLLALSNRKNQSIKVRIETSKLEMRACVGQLDALSPLKSLERGFAVALTNKQERIKSKQQVLQGDIIQTRVSDGKITSQVLRVDDL